MERRTSIEAPTQLLVEGNDQRNFFEAFAAHLGLHDVQVRSFGGVDELRGFLAGFVQTTGFATVRGLGVVRDAETSAADALRSVRSALENAGLAPPPASGLFGGGAPKTGVLILPDGEGPGMLETLLCRTFTGLEIDRCIESFFACVEALPETAIRTPDKARAFAFLATRPDPHHSVGVAAMRGDWDLDHAAFGPARAFLEALRAGPVPA